ncbi:MAG: O-antigen ligase family protein [Scytonematopsis contorta HA4267-MV1]|jgi:hypothetical protein|nr:O-antigen ligase family protein [Scytonematopsis contorta HA4267-MV1]
MKPQNFPETIVWYSILATYPIYLLGAQFVTAPLLATSLTFYLIKKIWNQNTETPPDEQIIISSSIWVWIIFILIIEFALIIGHLNFNLDIRRIFTSSLLWYRSWAMLALFPLVGHLNIRPQLIYRAICILCLQSLIITFIDGIAIMLNLSSIIYISPLAVLGGGEKQYEVEIFHNFITHRLQLFATYPTILALVSCLYFCCALKEKDNMWRFIGIFSNIIMLILSQSRTATIGLPFIFLVVYVLTNFEIPFVQFTTGIFIFLTTIFFPTITEFIKDFKDNFDNFRPGSSEIRYNIYQMTLEAWLKEGLIWGFGVRQEKGPKILAYLPLGSHHTWYGILYSHGLVGFMALFIAFVWSFLDLLIKAKESDIAKLGLNIILIIFICSLADNLEGFTHIYYPALIILGISLKTKSKLLDAQLFV